MPYVVVGKSIENTRFLYELHTLFKQLNVKIKSQGQKNKEKMYILMGSIIVLIQFEERE
jgi:hypothetical protein